MEFIIANQVEILGTLWLISEALSMIPSVKANGVFQLFVEAVKKARKK